MQRNVNTPLFALSVQQAAFTVSGLELGGLIGGTLAGFISDARIKKAAAESGNTNGLVGLRVQIMIVGQGPGFGTPGVASGGSRAEFRGGSNA